MPEAQPERSQSVALMRPGSDRPAQDEFEGRVGIQVAADQRVRALPRQRQPARRGRAEAEGAVASRHRIRVDRREVDPVARPGARRVESNNAPTSPHFLPASP